MIYWHSTIEKLRMKVPQLTDIEDVDEVLFECYCNLEMSIKQIAELCEISPFALREKLLRIGLKLKKRGGPRRKGTKFLQSDLEEMPIKDLCKKYGVSKTTIEKARRKLKGGKK